ncbi:unnamed protein product [Oikopleura dioica]|uniref:Uncharacterized protein n=1 Tax=Oikopleura dioica TaxID=34765 RepID=E4WXD5_OIKDI|nr:unnamed protein product [Oikopleura dioica]
MDSFAHKNADNVIVIITPPQEEKKEDAPETKALEANDEEDTIRSLLRVHPVAPPSTISYNENIGGKLRSPVLISVQLNSSGKNISCHIKIGSKGYLFRGFLGIRKKLEFKRSGRLDYQFELILNCERQKSHRCNLKYLLYCRNKKIEHRDFFITCNFLPGKLITKNQKQLDNHLKSCFFENALEKSRDLYAKTMVKMNCMNEEPLSPSQMRTKITELCEMTPLEAAQFYDKNMKHLTQLSRRYNKKLKK